MPKLGNLTKAEWKRIKKNAGIKKQSVGSSASVGKYVDALVKAQRKFDNAQTLTNIMGFNSALGNLKTALNNFKASKVTDLAKDQAKSLKVDIDSWIEEIESMEEVVATLAVNFEALARSEDKSEINDALDELGLVRI